MSNTIVAYRAREVKESTIYPILTTLQSGCLMFDLWMPRQGIDIVGLVWGVNISAFYSRRTLPRSR